MDCCNHQCEACHKHKERTPEEMKALINRLNRIEGQVRGIRGMVEISRRYVGDQPYPQLRGGRHPRRA